MFETIVKLSSLPSCPFPAANDRAAWESVSPADAAAIRAMAAEYRAVQWPLLTAGQYMAFAASGDRAVFEAPYFLRRRKLIAALLGECLDGGGLNDVIDGLWLICEESGWVISAHNGDAHAGVLPRAGAPLPDVRDPYVDLFAAQTAMILSLTCALLGDRLDAVSPLIRRRVEREIESRVLTPFETRDDFWWMGLIRREMCNWTPWIASNVMLTACCQVRDLPRLRALLKRCGGMLGRYLDALPTDGGCSEGPGYWSMAGGALLDALELMERVTGCRGAYWDDAKLRSVLRFPLHAWLGGDWFANFGDCDARPAIPGERLRFAGERLDDPALTALGTRFEGDIRDEIADTPQLWRLLNRLFHPSAEAPQAEPPSDVWLRDLQWRLLRRGGFALACKGGVNAGSHSHIDCGSFILLSDGEPEIVDAGNMTYTRVTFSDERHSLWNIRAAYHSVPMIGGYEQAPGPARRAESVVCADDGLSMDLARAYPPEAGVKACVRRLKLTEAGLSLSDDIELASAAPVTEVLMLRHRPEARGGAVLAGGVAIRPDVPMAVSIEEIPVTDPRMARSLPGSLWRLRLAAPASDRHQIRLSIERRPS